MPESEDRLVDAGGVAEILGLAHRHSVSTYRSRYPDFPKPVRSQGRIQLWIREDICSWQVDRARRGTRRRATGPTSRRDELVEAASRLMLASPGEEVGIRAIAAEAGIAHSDVYRYADSKEQLLNLAVDRLAASYSAAMPANLEELEAALPTFFAAAMSRRAGMRVVAAEVIRDPAAHVREPLPLVTLGRLIDESRARNGTSSEFDPDLLAAAIGSLLWGWALFGGRWRGGLDLGGEGHAETQLVEVIRRILQL